MMTKLAHCLALLCCLLFCSIPAHAVTPEHFFSTAEEGGKMISFLVEYCNSSAECLKKSRDNSYNEALAHRKAKKYQDAFMAGQFSWYAAVYLGVVHEYLKAGGKSVDAEINENWKYLLQLRGYFDIEKEQDFSAILKRSAEMVQAILEVAYEGDNSQSNQSQKR